MRDWTAITLAVAIACAHAPCAAGLTVVQQPAAALLQNFLSSANQYLSFTDASSFGPAESFGVFTNGQFGIASGVVLSTGKVTLMSSVKPDHDYPPVKEVGDSAALVIRTTPTLQTQFTFKYLFASLELPVYGGKEFNDRFEMRVNGINRAFLTDGRIVTINNIVPSAVDRSLDNPDYINNPAQQHFGFTGYTRVLSLTADANPNVVNTINISLVDVGDGNYDSAVFLAESTFEVIIPVTYGYVTSSWAPCSVTCGVGVQSRTVSCQSSDRISVDLGQCSTRGSTMPGSTQPCNLGACPTYQFNTGQWGACSVTCGTGQRLRDVTCTSSTGQFVDMTSGRLIGNPSATQSSVCNWVLNNRNRQGEISVGSVSSREQCVTLVRASCPGATIANMASNAQQQGECFCQFGADMSVEPASSFISCQLSSIASSSSNAVPITNCIGTMPARSEPCTQLSCPSYRFVQGAWDQCSVTCGVGYRSRTVTCQDVTTGVLGLENLCPGIKPSLQEQCVMQACVSYTWQYTQWGACDSTCGGGVANRDVYCLGSDSTRTTDQNCNAGLTAGSRPEAIKYCNNPECPKYQMWADHWCTAENDPCKTEKVKWERAFSCRDPFGNKVATTLCTGGGQVNTCVDSDGLLSASCEGIAYNTIASKTCSDSSKCVSVSNSRSRIEGSTSGLADRPEPDDDLSTGAWLAQNGIPVVATASGVALFTAMLVHLRARRASSSARRADAEMAERRFGFLDSLAIDKTRPAAAPEAAVAAAADVTEVGTSVALAHDDPAMPDHGGVLC